MEIVQQQTVELLKGLTQLHNDLSVIIVHLIGIVLVGAVIAILLAIKR